MQILLITGDEGLTETVKNEANTLGHIVLSSSKIDDIGEWKEDVDILVTDLRGIPGETWKKHCKYNRENLENTQCPYVIVFVDSEDMGVECGVVGGIGVDDIACLPSSPDEIRNILLRGCDGLEERRLSETSFNDPFAALHDEHLLLTELAVAITNLKGELNEKTHSDVLKRAVHALNVFDLSVHHAKEKALFDVLVNRVSEKNENWLFDLSENSFVEIEEEHDELEKMFREMGASVLHFTAGMDASGDVLKASITKYVSFLQSHMELEDTTIFPFAKKTLLEGDKRFLSRKFLSIHEDMGMDNLKKAIADLMSILEK